jgi:hypothetical protein
MSGPETYQAPVEAERRRPEGEFRPDVGIVLSDGVTWYLPKPLMKGKYHAAAGNGQTAEVGVTEYGPEYDFRAEELIVDSIRRQIRGETLHWFGSFLLKQNYILTDKDFYWILRVDDTPENLTMWMDIIAIAVGLVFMEPKDPKASSPAGTRSSGGRDTVSSPTGSTPTA